MSDVQVSVVVVLHNSASTLGRCIACALAQPEVHELILVDNASRDDWRAVVPDDPRLRCLVNTDNLGFAQACNQGARLAHGSHLLFLNPDCFLPPAAINTLLNGFALVPGVAVIGAQLANADGSPQAASTRRTPTPQAALAQLFRGASHGLDEVITRPAPGWCEVEAVSGALMLLRRTDFDALGGFDTGYRLHCEDLDLCRRVLLAGRRIALCDALQVTHVKGTSSTTRPFWVEWQKHRGMLRYFRKFDAARSPLSLRLLVPTAIVLRYPFAAIRAYLQRLRRFRTIG